MSSVCDFQSTMVAAAEGVEGGERAKEGTGSEARPGGGGGSGRDGRAKRRIFTWAGCRWIGAEAEGFEAPCTEFGKDQNSRRALPRSYGNLARQLECPPGVPHKRAGATPGPPFPFLGLAFNPSLAEALTATLGHTRAAVHRRRIVGACWHDERPT